MFDKKEKVFSLEKTTVMPPGPHLTQLFEELFGYLVVAGFYLEGCSSPERITFRLSNAASEFMWDGYHHSLSRTISKGLTTRYKAILAHSDCNAAEREFLTKIDGLFDSEHPTYTTLSASAFTQIAETRQFRPPYRILAQYAGVLFGQSQHTATLSLPKVYLSLFGNIHLASSETLTLTPPSLVYGKKVTGSTVTALYALLSSAVEALCTQPGYLYYFEELLAGLQFLPTDLNWDQKVSLPRLAAIARMDSCLIPDPLVRIPLVTRAYQQTLFATRGPVTLIRSPLFSKVINDMAKYLGGIATYDVLEKSATLRRALQGGSFGPRVTDLNPNLAFALEALDSAPPEEADPDAEKDPDAALNNLGETPDDSPAAADPVPDQEDPSNNDPMEQDTNPADDDGGYDPASLTPPASTAPPGLQNDSIGLISFNKTGEGIDEDLYRQAVLVLNDRLKSDDSIPVAADVKDALDQWVNGWMYRAAIKATQDRIANLKLQKYLKSVATKG